MFINFLYISIICPKTGSPILVGQWNVQTVVSFHWINKSN